MTDGFFNQFLPQLADRGSRSTILKGVGGMIALPAIGLLGSSYISAASWISIIFATAFGIAFMTYIGTHVYCVHRKHFDELRSEKFVIRKLEIERGLRGDDASGLVDPSRIEQSPVFGRGVAQPQIDDKVSREDQS